MLTYRPLKERIFENSLIWQGRKEKEIDHPEYLN